jgi:hypothetical protein
MGNRDKVDEIVEKLELAEVRKLAAQKLRGLVNVLQDDISGVAQIKRRVDTNPEAVMGIAISNYERTRETMQRYGLWEDRYEQVFLKAKETGEFDVHLFYGGNRSGQSAPQ